jgi:hypothetical protein
MAQETYRKDYHNHNRGMNVTTQIQELKGYKVVNKDTAVIITIIPKINHERFPEREFLHVPIWENE